MSAIELNEAKRMLEAVERKARELDVAMCAAVVDAGGNPVATMRMDGAQLGAYQLAVDKAWTAVAFEAPTGDWAEGTAPGGPGWGFSTALAGRVIVFEGGLPLMRGGRPAGGLGVSGSSPDVDGACARAGIEAIEAATA